VKEGKGVKEEGGEGLKEGLPIICLGSVCSALLPGGLRYKFLHWGQVGLHA
jgi:hypothetical protein